MMEDNIKVLWPDGPRWVPAKEIKVAAVDALCNEEDFGAGLDEAEMQKAIDAKFEELSLDEAIDIVNHHGYYTTAKRDAVGEGSPPYDAATATGMYD